MCLPVGLARSHAGTAAVATMSLEPGDVVLFFTDGAVEARSREGEQLGRDHLGELLERAVAAGQRPAETARLLGHSLLAHEGTVLQDDATLLLLSWRGPSS